MIRNTAKTRFLFPSNVAASVVTIALGSACSPPCLTTADTDNLDVPQTIGLKRRGTLSKVTAIAAGGAHSCALAENGTVRCWGDGTFGVLGYGNTLNVGDGEPAGSAGVVDVGGNVIRLWAGRTSTCALLLNGDLRCWGALIEAKTSGSEDGSAVQWEIGDDEVPASDANLVMRLPDLSQLGFGIGRVCAIWGDGAVHCWGNGVAWGRPNVGEDTSLGFGWRIEFGGTITQLAAGNVHVCGLLNSGGVRCWGSGADGQLGYSNQELVGDDETPAEVGNVAVGGKVVYLAAGMAHTCAIVEGGAVRCWGANTYGQLGYAHTRSIGDDEAPAVAGNIDLGGVAIQVAAGSFHTCALLNTGSVRCWGLGWCLGAGSQHNIGDDEPPSAGKDVALGSPVAQIAVGDFHTCALMRETGTVRCWGSNLSGELGYGHKETIGDDELPSGDVPLFDVEHTKLQ